MTDYWGGVSHILLVEDDPGLIAGLEFSLCKHSFEVDTACSEAQALALFGERAYGLLLLALALPDGSGFDICTRVRRSSAVPIIFLTASDQEVNVVMGLDMNGRVI